MRVLLRDHLDKLHSFNAIARIGSLRKAAEQLRTSQPSLTHAVRTLEEAAGAKLFRRSVKGMSLTAAGQALFAFSQKILNELQAVEEKLKFPTHQLSGIVSIGTYESLAVRLWPKFIKKFAKKYPFIQISLVTEPYSQLRQKLLSGDVQLIVTTFIDTYPDAVFENLYEDSFGFFCATSEKLQKNRMPRRLLAQNLKKMPFLLVPLSDCYGLALEKFLWRYRLDGSLIYKLDTFEAAREFAVEGVGVALIPKMIAADSVSRKVLREFSVDGMRAPIGPHRIGMYARRDMDENSLAKIVMAELKHVFSDR